MIRTVGIVTKCSGLIVYQSCAVCWKKLVTGHSTAQLICPRCGSSTPKSERYQLNLEIADDKLCLRVCAFGDVLRSVFGASAKDAWRMATTMIDGKSALKCAVDSVLIGAALSVTFEQKSGRALHGRRSSGYIARNVELLFGYDITVMDELSRLKAASNIGTEKTTDASLSPTPRRAIPTNLPDSLSPMSETVADECNAVKELLQDPTAWCAMFGPEHDRVARSLSFEEL